MTDVQKEDTQEENAEEDVRQQDAPEQKETPDEKELLKNEIEQLREENSQLKDQYLRKQADFENFRKRMTREKQDSIRFANKDLLLDLVTVIDDFERALKSADESEDFRSFKEGIAMIEGQMTGMLEKKWGLAKIKAHGEEFNPQLHEAMMMEESGEHEKEHVLEVFQSGYMLHDRVIRPSKVKVARPAVKAE